MEAYREPRRLKELLPAILRGLRRDRTGALGRVRAVWPAVIGEKLAARTRVAALEGGVLTVEVASAAVKHHLATFAGEGVLARLGEALPELRIRAVRYRVGRVS